MYRGFIRISLALITLAVAGSNASAQQAPPPDDIDEIGPYTVSSSIELGVRGVKVDGDDDKYRSDLNYDPGFRIFDSSFRLESEGSHAPLFDSLLVRASGWSADPSGYLRVNVEKLDVYNFDVNIRRSNYYNALRTLALKQHIEDTEHTFGDFKLTIMPQNPRFRAIFNYAFDRNNGPSLTTYDYSRNEFPIFSDYRTRADTFSGGFEARAGKVDITFEQGYRRYRDDTTFNIDGFEAGNSASPTLLTRLNAFSRDLPTRGRIHYTRFTAHTFLGDMVDISGRFNYSNSKTESTLFETVFGTDFLGNPVRPDQDTGPGEAERPSFVSDIGVSVLATDRLTISNTFSINWFEIDGSFNLNELIFRAPGAPLPLRQVNYSRLTDYRQFANTIELDYRFHNRLSAHIGYRYTDRSIDLEPLDLVAGAEPPDELEIERFDNRTNSFIFGLKAKPVRPWTIYFDLETGDADNVFTRVGNYEYTNVRLRNRVQATDQLSFNFSAVVKNNDNPSRADLRQGVPESDFGFNVESRIYSGSVDWVPSSSYSMSGGYTHTRITSDAVAIFYFNFVPRVGRIQYFMRDNYFYVNGSGQPHPRVGIYGGYRIHDDNAAGNERPLIGPQLLISSYPYRFQTGELKLAFKLHDRVDWNLGYQYYDFDEDIERLGPTDLRVFQDYSAHLPYTSLRFYFGRVDR